MPGFGSTERVWKALLLNTQAECLKVGVALENLTLDQLKDFSPLFTVEALELLPHAAVMQARRSEGGTAPAAVETQIQRARLLL